SDPYKCSTGSFPERPRTKSWPPRENETTGESDHLCISHPPIITPGHATPHADDAAYPSHPPHPQATNQHSQNRYAPHPPTRDHAPPENASPPTENPSTPPQASASDSTTTDPDYANHHYREGTAYRRCRPSH